VGGPITAPFDPPPPLAVPPLPRAGVRCTVCWWTGDGFDGFQHCESSTCPACGAIGRDRWLFECLLRRVPLAPGTRLLETSPRLGRAYREAMAQRLDYIASDFDERLHRADRAIDLQDIDMPDRHLDVVVSSHVLEHVPDTDMALSELYRVLRPGGSLILLVPVLQGTTAPPAEPEFHEDDTEVRWRFGLDLTARLRAHGFETWLLCTEDFRRHAAAGGASWSEGVAAEFDVESIVGNCDPEDLTVVLGEDAARAAALTPGYFYLAWHGRRPRRVWDRLRR
jgi:SAM-dependent methyltransferase